MNVNGVTNGVNMQAGQMPGGHEDDLISKNLKRQIEDLQKSLQEIAADTKMSGEEKMKKRQEIQKQINDLNMQLRQRQIELRKEKQQEKAESENIFDTASAMENSKGGKKTNGISQGSMEAMISADVSMKQAAKQGSVATKMEGRAGVLEMEIKLDSARNGDTSAKQKELANVEQKAANAAASQLDTLSKANKTLKEAADSEHDTNAAKEADAEQEANETEETGSARKTENAENVDNTESKEHKKGAERESGTVVDVRI
ncbi:MAG: FlxA-like family protein [Clostridiales bacterium]|nr:FlxA-like family protein [Clostridiales bacterium]